MNEREFIKTLKERASEQERLIKSMPFSKVFTSISFWFGNHPWRILIPLAFVLTLIFREILGKRYYEFVLKIFGKL